MHGLPTLQYLNDQQKGPGSAEAKKIIAEVFGEPEVKYVAPETSTDNGVDVAE
jgi:hypothetical protein